MHKTGGEVMNPDFALGPAKAIKEKNELIGVATFEPADINPLAEKILKKVDFGTIKATSVGFVPERGHFGSERDGEDPTAYYFDQHILKEFSIVHIPSNGDALKREFEAIEKFLIQEIETVKSNGIKSDFKRNHNTRKIQ
jgi:phage head maturation protease